MALAVYTSWPSLQVLGQAVSCAEEQVSHWRPLEGLSQCLALLHTPPT